VLRFAGADAGSVEPPRFAGPKGGPGTVARGVSGGGARDASGGGLRLRAPRV